jgi:hypothetical protein
VRTYVHPKIPLAMRGRSIDQIWSTCPRTLIESNEEAEGDAERLFMLAAEVVGVAGLNEPAEVSFRRRPNLKIEQRHRAE